MVCPSSTVIATAVSWTPGHSRTGVASRGTRLAMGLGVWSEPQGYASRVSCRQPEPKLGPPQTHSILPKQPHPLSQHLCQFWALPQPHPWSCLSGFPPQSAAAPSPLVIPTCLGAPLSPIPGLGAASSSSFTSLPPDHSSKTSSSLHPSLHVH